MGARVVAITCFVFAGLAAQEARPSFDAVRESRCDAGSTTRFDPRRIEENYRKVARELAEALSRVERSAISRLDDGYDAGLRDPVRRLRRTWTPPQPLPEQLRGLTIYVITIDRNGRIDGLPTEGTKQGDIVLTSRAARLKDCARLAPVTFLTPELAAALGIQTSRCRLVVKADGKEIDIAEGDLP